MAVEVTILVRFEAPPSHSRVIGIIEDAFEDATVMETFEEEV